MKRLALGALVLGITLTAALPAFAQTAAPDSGTIVPAPADTPPATTADTTVPIPPARAARAAVGRDMDRFEFGAAIVDGPYDAIGTFGYHRFFRRGGPFEQWIHAEISGAQTRYVDEVAASASYLFRPIRFIRRDWKIRPIVEAGPGGHLVIQVAEVQGFSESAFHAKGYLKMQGFLGFENSLGGRWGLVARGRVSVPAHRPFDYAQIALFLR